MWGDIGGDVMEQPPTKSWKTQNTETSVLIVRKWNGGPL